MCNETIPFNEQNFGQMETKYGMMSLETRRYELDLIFLNKILNGFTNSTELCKLINLNVPGKTLRHRLDNTCYTCNYRTNYAGNNTLYRICSEGNQISDKLNFFEESIAKFQTNLRSLLYYRLK